MIITNNGKMTLLRIDLFFKWHLYGGFNLAKNSSIESGKKIEIEMF